MLKKTTASLKNLLDTASTDAIYTAAPFELSNAIRKSLASTGHLVEQFLMACESLMKKVEAKQLQELLPYFKNIDLSISPTLQGTGIFVCPIHLCKNDLKLQPLLLTTNEARQILTAWRQVKIDVPKVLAEPLEIAAISNAPLWPALLHLRSLLKYWEQALRKNHVTTLLERLPRSWMLDPVALPPGAVIPKMEINSWIDFESNQSFFIQNTTSNNHSSLADQTEMIQAGRDEIHHALSSFHEQPHVLTESYSISDAILYGVYLRQNKRVELLGGLALHQDERSTFHISRWKN